MEPSKQLKPYLPGMENMSESGKAPHEMSPEEFAAHPYAVFHGTTRPEAVLDRYGNRYDPETGEYQERPPMHAGTKRAAVDRVRHTSVTQPKEDDETWSTVGHPAKIYTMWAIPKKKELGIKYVDELHAGGRKIDPDTGLANIETVGHNEDDAANTLGYYRNAAEDARSISTATRAPEQRYKLQSDYVREAVKAGKENEVHPHTLALYNQGKLDEGWTLKRKEVIPPPSQQETFFGRRTPQPWPQHEGGPDFRRIVEQYKRDKGKPGQ